MANHILGLRLYKYEFVLSRFTSIHMYVNCRKNCGSCVHSCDCCCYTIDLSSHLLDVCECFFSYKNQLEAALVFASHVGSCYTFSHVFLSSICVCSSSATLSSANFLISLFHLILCLFQLRLPPFGTCIATLIDHGLFVLCTARPALLHFVPINHKEFIIAVVCSSLQILSVMPHYHVVRLATISCSTTRCIVFRFQIDRFVLRLFSGLTINFENKSLSAYASWISRWPQYRLLQQGMPSKSEIISYCDHSRLQLFAKCVVYCTCSAFFIFCFALLGYVMTRVTNGIC